MAPFFWPESSYKSPNCIHKSPDSPNFGHEIYYVVIGYGGVTPLKDIINCMTRDRRVRRLMTAVGRLVRTFWPKKKTHHIRAFSKVLKLMALLIISESSHVTACPLCCKTFRCAVRAVYIRTRKEHDYCCL